MHKFSLLTSAGCTQVSVGQTDRQTDAQRETGSLTDGQTIADGGAAFDLLPQGGDPSG